MTQPLSRLRLLVLVVLLVSEAALAISLRTSGWIGTGHAIRSLMIAVAAVLPLVMTAVLLYRARVSLRRGQFSLRAIMALILVIGSYLALIPLFAKDDGPDLGPKPISNAVKFEVFQVAATGTPTGVSFTHPDTGAELPVTNPPIITTADISTVELLMPGQNHGGPSSSLSITLRPIGANRLLKATTAATGSKLVVVLDGEVLVAPTIRTPIIGGSFQVTGGRIHTDGYAVFNELTLQRASERDAAP